MIAGRFVISRNSRAVLPAVRRSANVRDQAFRQRRALISAIFSASWRRSRAADLVRDGRRSSIGRLSQRLDVTAVAALVVTAAFVMAGVMVRPLAAPALLALLALPPVAIALLAAAPAALREGCARSVLALVPLGLAMWAAHVIFHLVTGWRGLALSLQRAVADLGLASFPRWVHASAPAGGVLGLELLLLDAGLLVTLWVAWRIAGHAIARALPTVAVATVLWATGVWILCQPMAMRGMIH